MSLHRDPIMIVRTAARVLSVVLFILWGSFFLEHLTWFTTEINNSPPQWVFLALGLHLLLLIGYLLSFRWERTGAVIILIASVLFFGYIAGANALPFVMVSALPVLLYAYCWHRSKRLPMRTV